MKRISMALGVAATILVVAGSQTAWAENAAPPSKSAKWERKASEWAVETFGKALEKNKAKSEQNLKALNARPITPLPQEIVDAHKAQGFVIFNRPYGQQISRKASPKPEEVNVKAFSAALARDEWEPVQVGIWTLKDLKGFSYKVSDLVHADGEHKIEAQGNIRPFFGFNLWAPKGKKKKKSAHADGDIVVGEKARFQATFNEAPMALLDLASIDYRAQEAHGLWIDIYAPKDATPGTYKGQITFSVEGKEAAKRPLTVKVYPFELDPAKKWGRGAFISKLRKRDELEQMHDHGMNMVSWWTTAGYKLSLKDGKITGDFSNYQKYLKLLDEVGYVGPHMVFLGASDPKLQNQIFKILKRPTISDARNRKNGKAFQKSDLSPPFGDYLSQALKDFHRQMKEVGHGDLLACLLDEPDHHPRPYRPQWYNKMYALAEKGAPEVPTYGVFYHANDEDRLSHHHTVWMSNRPAARIADMSRKAGRQLWTYHGGFSYARITAPYRFRVGMIPWVYGATGTYFWANFWHKGDPFDPYSVSGTSTVSLPTPHGPLASMAIKNVREGIDDYRYMVTLEKLMEKANASSNEAAKEEAKAARAFLDSFRKPLFEKMGVRGGRPNFESDNTGKKKVGTLHVTGLKGAKSSIGPTEANTWAFAEFVRRDVAQRIATLSEKLK